MELPAAPPAFESNSALSCFMSSAEGHTVSIFVIIYDTITIHVFLMNHLFRDW